MSFELPKLAYALNALEPAIDEKTMEIHHGKHHATYINNLNAALEKYPDLQNKDVEDLLKDLNAIPEEIKMSVKNNGGGHYNHSLFWTLMTPGGSDRPQGSLEEQFNKYYPDFEKFKEEFSKTALSRFGSGWAWLVTDTKGELKILSTQNQDTPLSDGLMPIIGLDVWEHAYYLKYQNKRAEYIENWWSILNWDIASTNYTNALS